jgi:hypothetical protein
MAVPVTIDFVPPTVPDITKLHIYEGTSPNAVFDEIEIVTPVGTYPNYITRYTTTKATSKDNGFAIAWENGQGEISEMSNPMQGGTISW